MSRSFQYVARNSAGEEVSGLMQADSEASVARTLDERQLFPVRVTEQGEAKAQQKTGGKIALRHVGAVYGQLSDLLQAGVPLLRALETLGRASFNKNLAGVIQKVRDDVAAGRTLSDAMNEHPQAFTTLHTAMIRAGEQAGFLEDVLANLAGFIERVDDLRSRVRGALIYPMMLTIFGLAAMLFILIFLVPQFKPVFRNMPLPLPTVALFAFSDLLVAQWHVLGTLLVLGGVGTWLGVSSPMGKKAWERWRMRMPILGRVTTMVSITRFCRILGTLLANGVPIIQALNISKDATGCPSLEEAIAKATENVRAGEKLADPLKASGLFPAEIIEMIAVAEESNQLEKVLVQIADTVERRTNRQVDVAVRLVEPIILVLIAGAIGFMAVGLYYPIFNMAKTLR